MRELKFRAWDVSNKAMYTHEELVDGSVVNPDVLLDCLARPGNGYDTDTVLMQYTGLKDKNSKEIYEGDVVRYLEVVRYETGEKETWRTVEVKLWLDESAGSFYLYPKINSSTEVIGNIYENPELLK